jgi:hypothetical protein
MPHRSLLPLIGGSELRYIWGGPSSLARASTDERHYALVAKAIVRLRQPLWRPLLRCRGPQDSPVAWAQRSGLALLVTATWPMATLPCRYSSDSSQGR